MTRGDRGGKEPKGGEKKGGKEGENRGKVVVAVDIDGGGEGEQRLAVKEEGG